MAIKIKNEFLETENIEILKGLKNIKKKHDYTRVRIIMNEDGSGEIQAYDKRRSIGFQKVLSFENYDQLLSIFQEYFFVK